jgi:hypothetical protein
MFTGESWPKICEEPTSETIPQATDAINVDFAMWRLTVPTYPSLVQADAVLSGVAAILGVAIGMFLKHRRIAASEMPDVWTGLRSMVIRRRAPPKETSGVNPINDAEHDRGRPTQHQHASNRLDSAKKAPFLGRHHVAVSYGRVRGKREIQGGLQIFKTLPPKIENCPKSNFGQVDDQ